MARRDTPARLFGAQISPLPRAALAAEMAARPAPAGEGAKLLVTMNLDHVVQLRRSSAFRDAYASAWTVTADGAPICAYARLKGMPVPRVTGSDLLADMVDALRPGAHRPFFVVAAEDTGRRLVSLMAARGFDPSAVAWRSPSYGFEADPDQSAALAEAIRAHGSTHLIFGLGAPKSEVWIHRHRLDLGDLYACCFGSGPDFLVGAVRRAPKWMGAVGLEWAWRVARDPRRLFRRYFIDSWAFLPAVAQDLVRPLA